MMVKIQEKYVTDANGKKTAVLIEMRDYEKLCEYLEDMEDALELIRSEQNAAGFVSLEDWKKELKAEGCL